MPHVFGNNEVPMAVQNEPRLVAEPVGLSGNPSTAWPRLGDVPSKPKDFSSPTVIKNTMSELETDRRNAEAMQETVEGSASASSPSSSQKP